MDSATAEKNIIVSSELSNYTSIAPEVEARGSYARVWEHPPGQRVARGLPPDNLAQNFMSF